MPGAGCRERLEAVGRCKGVKVGWEEARGGGKVQRCKGGKVKISGLVGEWDGRGK